MLVLESMLMEMSGPLLKRAHEPTLDTVSHGGRPYSARQLWELRTCTVMREGTAQVAVMQLKRLSWSWAYKNRLSLLL